MDSEAEVLDSARALEPVADRPAPGLVGPARPERLPPPRQPHLHLDQLARRRNGKAAHLTAERDRMAIEHPAAVDLHGAYRGHDHLHLTLRRQDLRAAGVREAQATTRGGGRRVDVVALGVRVDDADELFR